MEFTSIADLTTGSTNCRLQCRVSRLWVAVNINTDMVSHLDMILVDSKGNDIWVQIPPLLMDTFQPLLRDQEVYIFSDFNVLFTSLTYRPIANEYIIHFSGKPTVEHVPTVPLSIPTFKFTFMKASEMKANYKKTTVLSDIVGQLMDSTDRMFSCKGGRKSTRKVIRMKLIEGDEVKVVLWGRLLPKLESIVNVAGESTVVLVISSIYVTEFNGEYSFSSSVSTVLLPYIDIPEVKACHAGIGPNNPPVLVEAPPPPEIPVATMPQLQELSMDFKNEGNVYSVECKVVDVHPIWCYMGCPTCVKKFPDGRDAFYCNKCKRTTNIKAAKPNTIRYRLRLRVQSESISATFVVFEQVAERFFGASADNLFQLNGNQIDVPPQQVLKILGNTVKFHVKFKINMYSSTQPDFIVVQIPEDPAADTTSGLHKDSSSQSINSGLETSGTSSHLSDLSDEVQHDTPSNATPSNALTRKQPMLP
ncbi:unnamed protein product [Linum trigynum]|uniref:Replication factor A C-terminal domain-containing protein n=1 Tax=Linum trigynum TaxID=586398 RepID=A0AAV2E8T1_9ROSI